ncbi:hypothetical protein NL533_33050, partial [Klebsiella pneumoniae]|nr:hypothetical protein [Klebsiella pneumoniae]
DARFSLPKRSLAQRLIPLDIAASNQPREMIWVPLNATPQEEEQIRAIYRRDLKASESSDQQVFYS